VRETLANHPEYFDPRQYGKVARAYMTEMYEHKITDVLGSDNKLANLD
jgi:fructose-bisphosphate aldolase class II